MIAVIEAFTGVQTVAAHGWINVVVLVFILLLVAKLINVLLGLLTWN